MTATALEECSMSSFWNAGTLFCLSLRKTAFHASGQGYGSKRFLFWTPNGKNKKNYHFHNGFVVILGDVKNILWPLYFMKFQFPVALSLKACLTCLWRLVVSLLVLAY